VKIDPTVCRLSEELRKSEVNLRRFWVYISPVWGQKPLRVLTPNLLWW